MALKGDFKTSTFERELSRTTIRSAPSTSTVGGVSTGASDGGVTTSSQTVADLGITALPFYITPSATASEAQLLLPGSGTALSMPMPFRGAIVGLALSGSSKSAGTATLMVYKNGVVLTGAQMVWTTGLARQSVAWPRGTYGFVKGDYLDLRLTTSSLSPTSVLQGWLFVIYDQTEAV